MLITGNESIKKDRVRNIIYSALQKLQGLLAKYRLHRLTEKVCTERKAFKRGKLWILELYGRTKGDVEGWCLIPFTFEISRVYQINIKVIAFLGPAFCIDALCAYFLFATFWQVAYVVINRRVANICVLFESSRSMRNCL